MKIYVEGGGNNNSRLKAELRQGFQALFLKAGFAGKLPSVIASGSRNEAYHSFKIALNMKKDDEMILLLVDSEDSIKENCTKWEHVEKRDSWEKPTNACEDNLFFMVECMESWFLADKNTLEQFYGNNFKVQVLPSHNDLEQIKKTDIYNALGLATKKTTKGEYGKGAHSFKILAQLDAIKVQKHGTHAQAFFEYIKNSIN